MSTHIIDRTSTCGDQIADHVNYLGLGSSKDWELMKLIVEQDYTFVTNNRTDFLALYQRVSLHAGLVIIHPERYAGLSAGALPPSA
jgi:hypothetical protein